MRLNKDEQYPAFETHYGIPQHRMPTLRRVPLLRTNQQLITCFAVVCGLVVVMVYLETSRMLIPQTFITTTDLYTLTSGFTNDLPLERNTRDLPLHLTPVSHHPKALMVGFTYCGGHDLLKALSLHPEIAVNLKDTKFFAENKSLEWYLSRQPLSLAHHVTVDFSFRYIHNKTAMRRIKEFNDTIRIVVVVCDPISRLVDNHNQFLQKQRISKTKPLASGVEETIARNFTTKDMLNRTGRSLSENDLSTASEVRYIIRGAFPELDADSNTKSKSLSVVSNKKALIFKPEQNATNDLGVEFLQNRPNNVLQRNESILDTLRTRILTYFNGSDKLTNLIFPEIGDYVRRFDDLFHIFSKDQVLIVEKNRFLKNPSSELSRMHKFLGVRDVMRHNKMHYDWEKHELCCQLKRGRQICLKHNYRVDYNMLRDGDSKLFERLKAFFRPYNEKLFLYLNDEYEWS